MTNQMTIEQAREIANRKLDHVPTDSEWASLFEAEDTLKANGEVGRQTTYNE